MPELVSIGDSFIDIEAISFVKKFGSVLEIYLKKFPTIAFKLTGTDAEILLNILNKKTGKLETDNGKFFR